MFSRNCFYYSGFEPLQAAAVPHESPETGDDQISSW